MMNCPNCGATLPPSSHYCQFCQTQFGQGPSQSPGRGGTMPPSRSPLGAGRTMPGAPSWVPIAYNLIALWWVIDGAWGIQRAFAAKNGPNVIVLIISVVTALIGAGLLARVEAARGVTNVLCFIQILDAGFGLIISFFMTGILGVLGAILMILNIVRLATAGLMIYLLGETD